MVASGVNTELTSVAPYRLMTHFGLALLIIAWCVWLWLELGAQRRALPAPAVRWTNILIWLVAFQMAFGALVAGLDAGRGYTDWPLMSGQVVPKAMWALDPFWRNFFENEATTQFFHRVLAYSLAIVAGLAAWRFRFAHWSLFPLFAAFVAAQAVLGIITLVNAAPLGLALFHQALGVLVLVAATRLLWTARP